MKSYLILNTLLLSLLKINGFSKSSWFSSKTSLIFDRINKLNDPQSSNSIHSRKYQYFQLKKFPNSTNVRCNDGSIPGYYTRPSTTNCSKKWLIFLEGGWYCFNNNTCESRRRTHYDLFSSEFWSSERQLGGILSNNERINPNFHDYNSVYIPYCSSDLWSGKQLEKTNGLYFHGSRILDTVVDDLTQNQHFKKVHEVAFVGSSAGGIGVLLNIDRLKRRLKKKLKRKVFIHGIVDSAWFLDYPAYRQSNCTHIYECPPENALRNGMKLWNPRIPRRCKKFQGRGREWKCFMGPVIYRHLKNPTFIIQSLFDDAQLQMSKVPILEGGSNKKFSYIQQLGGFAAQTLRQAKGVFAHSCVDHEILTKSNWAYVSVNNQRLHETLNYWQAYLEGEKKKIKKKVQKNPKLIKTGKSPCKNLRKPKFSGNIDQSKYQLIDSCHISQITSYKIQLPHNRTLSRCANAIPLIPLCNPTCSPLSHPISGLSMSFIDLLELYNVRINLIAKSLGISMEQLRKMNTQQQISLLYCSSR
uniref:Palmitoleoyl-protein carboxylesterase NOTUM n=1 Tax=Schmidtea mediterranea TaxID=79327 RepID=NOTUM_SCHMD|nr:RecName: Full=Palmitoleoyl-protein carboxylesterase NOTUM; Short=Smed-notum; Flags: Precursor [Schmidtea mediterranea]AEF01556.1 notum [Schmidtea mediterranea]